MRLAFDLYPPYWGTGIRVTAATVDLRRVRIEMPLRFYNRNAVGTHFGGNLYAMTDPFVMLMLMHNLGRRYQVWDSQATIEFVRPGTGRVSVDIELDADRLADIEAQAAGGDKCFHRFDLAVKDESGETVARVAKTLYVRLARAHRPAHAGHHGHSSSLQ